MTLRILVVEDEAVSAMAIRLMLESSGATVIGIADSGEEAIALALKLLPDLVLMDIRLKGGMNGIESAKIIRAHLHIPIIIVTAYTAHEIRESYSLTDEFLFINKPIQESQLTESIVTACRQGERSTT
jgi:CheY-like chemotaxis protein